MIGRAAASRPHGDGRIKVLLEEWLSRIPNFSRRPGTEPGYTTTLVRGVSSLFVDVLQ